MTVCVLFVSYRKINVLTQDVRILFFYILNLNFWKNWRLITLIAKVELGLFWPLFMEYIYFVESENENKSKKITIWVFAVSILVIILIIILLFINQRTSITPKARKVNVSSSISIANSYVFSSPVRAKANGDLIRVTVFVLDEKGGGIVDKKVSIREGSGLTVREIQALTDEVGKAIFDISSTKTGVFYLEVEAAGIILPQRTKVVFD